MAQAIIHRVKHGKNFSIVAVSEGAMDIEEARTRDKLEKKIAAAEAAGDPQARKKAKNKLRKLEADYVDHTLQLAHKLEALTGLESRPTILGHLQRGGTPSAGDRLLATRLGSACANYINQGISGVMVAARGEGAEAVPLEEVAGNKKLVPVDHPWIESARNVGVCVGE